ncbi:MAG: insulinase family protein [Candidatus Zixiibacteriota bacterium]|nr:MAG: insulinase family protein [candidate division Zixibacteria bacterium]
MRRNITLIMVFVLVLALLTLSAQAQDVDKLKFPKLSELKVPEVDRVTLDNGIRLYLLEDKSLPLFHVSVRVNCGSYLEPEDKVGLADICGTVMRTGGTAKWTGDEIDELLEGVGASVETYIGTLSGGARVNVLSEYTDLGLEVLSEVLRRPVFEEDKIELAKVQERSAIARRNDDPQGITFREYRKIIYGANSPYARHSEYATINSITRDDLVAFHKAYFHPQNVQIAVWGDFDKAALLSKISQYFGDWQRAGELIPEPPKVDYEYQSKVYYVEKTDVNQSNIVMGHIGGLLTDEDYADRIVMNNVLGGSFGSRLFNSVRSREGLAYAVFGVYTANIKYPGVFYNYASTKSESTCKAVLEIIKEIKRMQTDPPTEDEMRMGKDGYLNSFVFKFDSKAEVVTRLMRYDFYGLPEDFLFREKENVEKVKPDDVIAAAKNNLHPEALHILVVGKGEDFDMPLEQLGFGSVDTVDITIPSAEEKKELAITPENLKKGMEVLQKAVEAHGGLENFKKVNSISIKGTYLLSMRGTEIPIAIEWLRVLPDKNKSVMSVMGQKILQIRNGNSGWKTDQMTMELTAMTEEDIADDKKNWDRSTIQIFASSDDPYYQAVYDGTGKVNEMPVAFVELVDKDDEPICRLAFNSETYELVGKFYYDETPLGAGTIEETVSNFSQISGVKLPMTTVRFLNDQKMSQTDIAEFIINGEIPPDAFDKPE